LFAEAGQEPQAHHQALKGEGEMIEPACEDNDVPSELLEAWIDQAPVGHALVLGASEGGTARWLAARGFRVDAVEKDELACDRMRRVCQGSDVQVFGMDLINYPLPKERYSLVIALAVLHFLLPTDLWQLSDRLTESLIKGGILIAEVFTTDDPGYDALIEASIPQVQPNTFPLPAPIHLIHYFEPGELARLFRRLTILLHEEARRTDWVDREGLRAGASLVARRD
jgi:SAM-dependent methyltransferase